MSYFSTSPKRSERGLALLLAVIIASLVLAIGLGILHVTMKQLDLGTSTRGSEVAYQAAASAADCILYLRRTESALFLAPNGTSNIPISCLGLSNKHFAESNPASNVFLYQSGGQDWTAGSDTLCVAMDVYILNASGQSSSISYSDAIHGSMSCTAGDVCTYGYARGHNDTCANLGLSNFNTYQRELTVEF